MNPGFAWIFYFVDNGSRNFVDCVDGVHPALGGVQWSSGVFAKSGSFNFKK